MLNNEINIKMRFDIYNDAYFEDEDSMDVNMSNGIFSMDELDDIESEGICDINMIELSSDSLDMVEYCGVELDTTGYCENCQWDEFKELNRQNKKFDEWNKSNYSLSDWDLFLMRG